VVLLRILVGLALTVLALLVAAQFALPPLAESQIEDRLTEHGGTAEATVEALPAALLLVGDGDRLEVRGSRLDLRLEDDTDVFENLDGYDEVEIRLEDFRAGPLTVAGFKLSRDGDAPYQLSSSSSTSPADLLDYGASRFGLPNGPLFRFFEDAALGSGEIPIELDMELESDDGQIQVVSGGGTIAGFPTGPLAQLITATIVVQL
jgi:hypothetical protein